ncbi:hypothetical protein LPJ61_004408, partial [Coemansia biformis]
QVRMDTVYADNNRNPDVYRQNVLAAYSLADGHVLLYNPEKKYDFVAAPTELNPD